MNSPTILAGLETEYGLWIEGRGPADQIDDAACVVASFPGVFHDGWDYRFESPRSDLRGFVARTLAVDPEDRKLGRQEVSHVDHADRVLANGARFYNDHGHPEYATPECWSLDELATHDVAGEIAVLRAAKAYELACGLEVNVFKNNTDFHGSSYGSHESYLLPRSVGFESLFAGVAPMLVCRQVLCGAGKVGAETGSPVPFQISARADFISELASVDTLFRRPLFNTRDEPHADPKEFQRLHVICGDANRIVTSVKLRVGLAKLALRLVLAERAPALVLADCVSAFRHVSRSLSTSADIALQNGASSTPEAVLLAYCQAAECELDLDDDTKWTIDWTRALLSSLSEGTALATRHIDWVAKRAMLDEFLSAEGGSWDAEPLRAFDLGYHNPDPHEGLYSALLEMGKVEPPPPQGTVEAHLRGAPEGTRAFARALAVSRFGRYLHSACWRVLTFDVDGERFEVELHPDRVYDEALANAPDVRTFVELLRNAHV